MIEIAISENNLQEESVHAKALLCCIFDSLAKSRFPNEKKNGKRFKKTITQYANWDDSERMSLLHLIRAFKVADSVAPEFNRLRGWASAEFSKKFSFNQSLNNNQPAISTDPLLSVVRNYWPTCKNGNLKSLGCIRIDHLLHKHLLWLYRNRLVHEFRIPGLGSESPFRLEYDPYYQEVSTIDYSCDTGIEFTDPRWELVYPTGFFLDSLVKTPFSQP